MISALHFPSFALSGATLFGLLLGSASAQSGDQLDPVARMMAKLKAERVTAEASWRSAAFRVTYGDVAVGEHGLHELPGLQGQKYRRICVTRTEGVLSVD